MISQPQRYRLIDESYFVNVEEKKCYYHPHVPFYKTPSPWSQTPAPPCVSALADYRELTTSGIRTPLTTR